MLNVGWKVNIERRLLKPSQGKLNLDLAGRAPARERDTILAEEECHPSEPLVWG